MAASGQIFGRVLLTNDDGVDAPGLQVLQEVAAELAREVWVVAPQHDQSGTSHSLSLHNALRVHEVGERRFAVSGTPGDSVAMALRHVMAGNPPDVILSGINKGANLGRETVFSGTVGAAMTGMLMGVPSFALSQAFTDRANVPWGTGRALAAGVIRRFAGLEWGASVCLNINFPACAPEAAGEVTLTEQGLGALNDIGVVSGSDPRGVGYHWLQLKRGQHEDTPDSETTAIRAGRISVTPLRFERTHDETLARLRAAARAPA